MHHPTVLVVLHRGRTTHPCVWLAIACLLIAAPAERARAQAGCVPPAVGVPHLPGPPRWFPALAPGEIMRGEVRDPRWVGSLRQDFPTQFASEGTFRALNAGDDLYLTFQTLTDPNGTTQGDTIWVGIGSGGTSHLFMFDLDGADGAGPTSISGSYWTKTGGGAGGWSAGLPPGWAKNFARWVTGPAGSYAWVVNMRLQRSGLGGAGLGSNFKFWYAITVNQSGIPLTTALYQWPVGGVSTTAPENVFSEGAVNPDLWGDASVGSPASPCVGGIALAWNQIGADPPPQNQISTTGDNQFFATPNYGSFAVVANMIKARFRFANWGSTIADKQNAPWIDIPLPAAGAPNDGAGAIRFTCTHGAPTPITPACPAPSAGNPDHQCMLVELSKTAQPPGVVPNLFFSRDSAYRNMTFTAASRMRWTAEVSLHGLAAKPDSATRDVYLYVQARNMPAPSGTALELPRARMLEQRRAAEAPPKSHGYLPPWGQRGDLAAPVAGVPAATIAAAGQAGSAPLPDSLAKSSYEHLAEVWPNYEVHAFYDTGKTLVLNGQKHILVEPMIPFGYFVDHQGALYGWEHRLAAQDTQLEQLASNYYRVRVANGGAVHLAGAIDASETPKPGRDQVEPIRIKKGCHCSVVGSGARGTAALLCVALLCAAIGMRLRRRRADPKR